MDGSADLLLPALELQQIYRRDNLFNRRAKIWHHHLEPSNFLLQRVCVKSDMYEIVTSVSLTGTIDISPQGDYQAREISTSNRGFEDGLGFCFGDRNSDVAYNESRLLQRC
jgi:hypothetical protein